MSNEPKLPTESKWLKILGGSGIGRPIIDELRERGLIASEPVDPLDAEVERIERDWPEEASSRWLVVTALRRGMEIEREKRPVLTREGLEDKIYHALKQVDIHYLDRYDFGPSGFTSTGTKFADDLFAALQEQLK